MVRQGESSSRVPVYPIPRPAGALSGESRSPISTPASDKGFASPRSAKAYDTATPGPASNAARAIVMNLVDERSAPVGVDTHSASTPPVSGGEPQETLRGLPDGVASQAGSSPRENLAQTLGDAVVGPPGAVAMNGELSRGVHDPPAENGALLDTCSAVTPRPDEPQGGSHKATEGFPASVVAEGGGAFLPAEKDASAKDGHAQPLGKPAGTPTPEVDSVLALSRGAETRHPADAGETLALASAEGGQLVPTRADGATGNLAGCDFTLTPQVWRAGWATITLQGTMAAQVTDVVAYIGPQVAVVWHLPGFPAGAPEPSICQFHDVL